MVYGRAEETNEIKSNAEQNPGCPPYAWKASMGGAFAVGWGLHSTLKYRNFHFGDTDEHGLPGY